jgi:hypothetical protein
VRAAAWHGVYAFSGLTDPAAARGAPEADAPAARGAFAWEVARLLGPSASPEALATTVVEVWRGERAPVTGPPTPPACWTVRLVPRIHLGYDGARTLRTWSGGERFVSPEPEADLRIAALEARWSLGGEFPPALLLALLTEPDAATRLTAARHVGANAAAFPDLATTFPGQEELRELAASVRTAQERGSAGRSVVNDGGTKCGG